MAGAHKRWNTKNDLFIGYEPSFLIGFEPSTTPPTGFDGALKAACVGLVKVLPNVKATPDSTWALGGWRAGSRRQKNGHWKLRREYLGL